MPRNDRHLLALAAACLLAWTGPTRADADAKDPFRQAILIGVWDYRNDVGPLTSMDDSLRKLTKAFRDLRFDSITLLPNPTRRLFEGTLHEAANISAGKSADRATLTVVYFAGHGTMVNNTSYLLAKDFVRPADASEVALHGGVGTGYIGKIFSDAGQPLLLLVEACRNPFTPAETPPAVIPDAADVPTQAAAARMIAAPGEFGSYAVFYGQEPGEVVELPLRAAGMGTPLVEAFGPALELTSSAVPLFAEVRRRVIDATQGKLRPEYLDRGGGEIHLAYDDNDRRSDRDRWLRIRQSDKPELVKGFLTAYRTSRYAAAARKWLRDNARQASTLEYVAFTDKVRELLGQTWARASARPVRLGSGVVLARHGADAIAMADIQVLRPDVDRVGGFDALTHSGRSVPLDASMATLDPTKLPGFWADDQALALRCSSESILAGACAEVEAIATDAKGSNARNIGTWFLALVLNGEQDSADPIGKPFDLALAIDSRFSALGVPGSAYAFRTLQGADVPGANAALIARRGDGRPSAMEIRQ